MCICVYTHARIHVHTYARTYNIHSRAPGHTRTEVLEVSQSGQRKLSPRVGRLYHISAVGLKGQRQEQVGSVGVSLGQLRSDSFHLGQLVSGWMDQDRRQKDVWRVERIRGNACWKHSVLGHN